MAALTADVCPDAPVRVKLLRARMDEHVTIPERVASLERQAAILADAAANLVAIVGALTAIVANLRVEVWEGHYDAALPDLEKDLKRLRDLIDEEWPPTP